MVEDVTFIFLVECKNNVDVYRMVLAMEVFDGNATF